MKRHIVVALTGGRGNKDHLAISVYTEDGVHDPMYALGKATQEYLFTPEGLEYLDSSGPFGFQFNIEGFFAAGVPNEFLVRHGVYAVYELSNDLVHVVDHNTPLVQWYEGDL